MTYRAEPIKQRQVVAIPNLQKDKATVVDLAGELKFNLLVTGIDVDLAIDDEELLQSDDRTNQFSTYTQLYVNVVNRKTNLVIKRLIFAITSYPSYTNEIILNPDHIYEIKPDKDINLLTFTGEPVHLREPIVFLSSVVKETLTPRGKK